MYFTSTFFLSKNLFFTFFQRAEMVFKMQKVLILMKSIPFFSLTDQLFSFLLVSYLPLLNPKTQRFSVFF